MNNIDKQASLSIIMERLGSIRHEQENLAFDDPKYKLLESEYKNLISNKEVNEYVEKIRVESLTEEERKKEDQLKDLLDKMRAFREANEETYKEDIDYMKMDHRRIVLSGGEVDCEEQVKLIKKELERDKEEAMKSFHKKAAELLGVRVEKVEEEIMKKKYDIRNRYGVLRVLGCVGAVASILPINLILQAYGITTPQSPETSLVVFSGALLAAVIFFIPSLFDYYYMKEFKREAGYGKIKEIWGEYHKKVFEVSWGSK